MSTARRHPGALVVPLDLIDAHPANVREMLGDLTEMAESIRLKGVIQPVVVRPQGERFQLITGHRRCAAARIAGKTEVPAIIRHEATDADVVEDMLIENMHRRRLNPIEEAKAFQALIDASDPPRTQAQVASAVGISVFTVNSRLALLELTAAEQRAIANKTMSMAEGWEIAHQRRWERGERRGQGGSEGKAAAAKNRKPHWTPHFNVEHRLAERARAHCNSTHAVIRALKVSDVACGECWETVIRQDAISRSSSRAS